MHSMHLKDLFYCPFYCGQQTVREALSSEKLVCAGKHLLETHILNAHFGFFFLYLNTSFSLNCSPVLLLRLPNMVKTGYMNSTLQGLLALTHFLLEVHNQHRVWSFQPQSKFLR